LSKPNQNMKWVHCFKRSLTHDTIKPKTILLLWLMIVLVTLTLL
jgi:hypothetical protein